MTMIIIIIIIQDINNHREDMRITRSRQTLMKLPQMKLCIIKSRNVGE